MCFFVQIVNLRQADGHMVVLRNLRSAACVFERLCFYSTIFIAFVIALHSSMLNWLVELPLLFYFVLYPVWC